MTGSSVAQQIIVGVDTHKDVHVAAAIDVHGRLLGHLRQDPAPPPQPRR
jgi:hypothetical protein